jgi:uncharacterized protein YprB with RNaseH-like and TPR domain
VVVDVVEDDTKDALGKRSLDIDNSMLVTFDGAEKEEDEDVVKYMKVGACACSHATCKSGLTITCGRLQDRAIYNCSLERVLKYSPFETITFFRCVASQRSYRRTWLHEPPALARVS